MFLYKKISKIFKAAPVLAINQKRLIENKLNNYLRTIYEYGVDSKPNGRVRLPDDYAYRYLVHPRLTSLALKHHSVQLAVGRDRLDQYLQSHIFR